MRSRLSVLSEVPKLWAAAAEAIVTRLRDLVGDEPNDPLVEIALIQLVLGAHPISLERLTVATSKAAREAKRMTSWVDQDDAYEKQIELICAMLLDDPICKQYLSSLLEVLIPYGRMNSLSSTLLAFTSPGVADLDQGDEVWNLALADPDNRRLVDFDAIARIIAEARAAVWNSSTFTTDEIGVNKAHVIGRSLAVRRNVNYVPCTLTAPGRTTWWHTRWIRRSSRWPVGCATA